MRPVTCVIVVVVMALSMSTMSAGANTQGHKQPICGDIPSQKSLVPSWANRPGVLERHYTPTTPAPMCSPSTRARRGWCTAVSPGRPWLRVARDEGKILGITAFAPPAVIQR
jgi:hypothetical protein